MQKTKKHINFFRHVLWMWFVLFALSPCAVKNVLSNSVNVQHTKPLNKSQTAAPATVCSYTQPESQQTSVVQVTKIDKQLKPTCFFGFLSFSALSVKGVFTSSKKTSGSSLPKYILYKRLKIAMA